MMSANFFTRKSARGKWSHASATDSATDKYGAGQEDPRHNLQCQLEMAPHLSLGNEALYAQFQQVMDTQFQVGELKRIILTLPALPSEGY